MNPMHFYPARLWFEAIEVLCGRQSPWRYKILNPQMEAVCVPWWWP